MNEKNKLDEKELELIKKAAYEGAKDGIKKHSRSSMKSGLLLSIGTKVLMVVLIVVLVPIGLSRLNPFHLLAEQFSLEEDVENHDLTLENHGVLGYTAADFAEVILGDSTKLHRLEVFSQDVSEIVTVTKASLIKIKAFSKSKTYTYTGKATYVVDLSALNADSVSLDEENKIVYLSLPHTTLPDENLNVPQENVKISDINNGILPLTELKLTDEEINQLSAEAKAKMREKLEVDQISVTADEMAKMVVWEMYQPMISGMAPGYTLEITFIEG